MSKIVRALVVTGVELGWDCVVGVYPNEAAALKELDDEGEHETLESYLKDYDTYIVHEQTLELK